MPTAKAIVIGAGVVVLGLLAYIFYGLTLLFAH